MKERTKLVLEWERRWNEAEGGPVSMAELCRMYGVSRKTGYTRVGRYRAANHDVRAVGERSRRPKIFPTALPAEVEDLIVEARKRWPRWGPRKLRQHLVEANPGVAVPSTSVMSKVLKRRGMTVRPAMRPPAASLVKRPSLPQAPPTPPSLLLAVTDVRGLLRGSVQDVRRQMCLRSVRAVPLCPTRGTRPVRPV